MVTLWGTVVDSLCPIPRKNILWTTDVAKPQPHRLPGAFQTLNTSISTPKKDAEKCVQDGSGMIFPQSFQEYNWSNMLGELWFCEAKGWKWARIQFQNVENSHPKLRYWPTNMEKEQITADQYPEMKVSDVISIGDMYTIHRWLRPSFQSPNMAGRTTPERNGGFTGTNPL